MTYNVKKIEQKWQNKWQEKKFGYAKPNYNLKKYYCLDMFPYPSGSGLHVGHWRGYVLSDIYARMKLLHGYNVLHPMGWDAFGLPAENDAIKKGIPPQQSTALNIQNFKRQLKQTGCIYDWSKELNTTDPSFYKWTQWIFLKMYKAGLAYQANVPINWCPSCMTGIANEEVVQGGCERCGTLVEQKKIRQWMLRITAYAQKLLSGLEKLKWPENVKTMQRNWIGKSKGLVFTNPVKDSDIALETFSARFEAFAADTFLVIAPDHPLLDRLLEGVAQKEEIKKAAQEMINKRKSQRAVAEVEGIFTGRYTIDPVGNGHLPIWIANYVLPDYGTGIVKCSAHDERDFIFAKKYNIPLKVSLVPQDPMLRKQVERLEVCYTDMQNGILLHPEKFAGHKAGELRDEIMNYCVEKGYARIHTSYKLRDWVFSRQRYWGEPIPIIHCVDCGVVPVPENKLPVELPNVDKYAPTGTGESPLADISEWVNTTCPQCDGPAQRETNTMPQWAGSSWYFLRYPNPHLSEKPFDKNDIEYWLPVDLYVGGIEHAILHLLYARFYVKVLHDLGYLPFDEPFTQLFNQGMINRYSQITGQVEKMSKSKGNVVNPDHIVEQYGSDVLRMYMLFIGPPELDCEWQNNGLDGIKRFLQRLWSFLEQQSTSKKEEQKEATKLFHHFLKKYQERLDQFKPNTAVSAAMEFLNAASEHQYYFNKETIKRLLTALSIMVPFFSAELLEQLCDTQLDDCTWPEYDPELAQENSIEIAVQINGKTRTKFMITPDAKKETVLDQAKFAAEHWLQSATITREIYVPGRLVNFVIQKNNI